MAFSIGTVTLADGTQIGGAFLLALHNRLSTSTVPLSYTALLEENPLNVWALPVLVEADSSILSKIKLDGAGNVDQRAVDRLNEQ